MKYITSPSSMMTSSNISALLAICAGNSPVTGEIPAQRPVTRSTDVFFDLRLNKRFSKQSWSCRFKTPSLSLWPHRNVYSRFLSGHFPYLPMQLCDAFKHCMDVPSPLCLWGSMVSYIKLCIYAVVKHNTLLLVLYKRLNCVFISIYCYINQVFHRSCRFP